MTSSPTPAEVLARLRERAGEPFDLTIPVTVYRHHVERGFGRPVTDAEWRQAREYIGRAVECDGDDFGVSETVYNVFVEALREIETGVCPVCKQNTITRT